MLPLLLAATSLHSFEAPDFRGYVTSLQGAAVGASDTASATLGSQQRLNALWDASERVRVVVEGRGRLYLGEDARPAAPLAALLGHDRGAIDLSVNPVATEGAVWNAQLDRAYAEYGGAVWDLRAGRQRIHWGTDLYWNPADLFNARDALDFDHEESPGTDAVRLRYFAGGVFWTGAETAVSVDDARRVVAAGRAMFHAGEYDMNIIVGSWRGEPVGALGFAGNLGRAGWKGEVAGFSGYGTVDDPIVNSSTTVDYVFSWEWLEGLYLGGSLFLGGTGGGLSAANVVGNPPSARNPFPARFATQIVASRPVNPAVSWQASLLWLPEDEEALFSPSINYAAAQRVDMQLIGRVQAAWSGGLRREAAGAWVRTRLSF